MAALDRNFTMEEAADWLHVKPFTLKRIIDRHMFYFKVGRKLLFSTEHLVSLYAAMRDEGHPPIEYFEAGYIESRAAVVRRAKYTSDEGFVYFIEAGGFVKIGFSRDWKKRLHHIKTASPFPATVLIVGQGTLADERRFHAQFAEYHHHLEWFRYEGALKAFVQQLMGPK